MTFRFLTGILLLSSVSFAQVNEIKRVSDKAHTLINPLRNVDVNVLGYVNPFIGTGGHGHTFPGATVPFGMVQLSPDTRKEGWDGCGGYHYTDSIIHGFSHTHLSGTGVPDYADLLITPVCGTYPKIPSYQPGANYGSRFKHADEKASPGNYHVKLLDGNIDVDLTASPRTGIHRYTFQNPGQRYLVLDLDYRDKVLDAGFQNVSNQVVAGYRTSQSWAKQQSFFFYLTCSVPFEKSELITANGQHRMVLSFGNQIKELEVRVGISAVDTAGAALNLSHETDQLSFDKIAQNASNYWQNELSKIQVESNNTAQKVIFYTALYHTMIAPNVFSDVDGRYRGRDLKIHTITQKIPQYTVFSLWDTYRATHPLFCLIDQKRTLGYLTTFLRQFEEGGDLPVWELAGNETECMIGYHSASVLADAFVKGIRGFDVDLALKAMVATAETDEFGKKQFNSLGMISSDHESESVSKALEYAYDAFCVSAVAKQWKLESNTRNNYQQIEDQYRIRSYGFIHHFDPKTKFMRPRRGAQWLSPFDPTEVNFNFTEANSWQYSLYAPQHPELLTNLIGGKKAMSQWLDSLFYCKRPMSGRDQADITGLIGQYAHGNEPSHHVAYMYNYSATPWKTQFFVDSIQRSMYHNSPDGLSGNEDCGQMSAWFVLSALGFYPIAPGTPSYEIGHPLFDKATVRLENGKTLTVLKSGTGVYLKKVILNGKSLNRLQHSALMEGGTLEFEMGTTPTINTPQVDQYTVEIPEDFVPLPYISSSETIFEDSLRLEFGTVKLDQLDVTVEYALAHQGEEAVWIPYHSPFYITNSVTVKLRTKRVVGSKVVFSPTLQSAFIKKDKNVQFTLKTAYAPAYAASGPNTLVDKIRGSNDFRTGDWQGFQGTDIVAEVQFKRAMPIKKLGISFLRDVNSWIFDPAEVRIEVSKDGKVYTEAVNRKFNTITAEAAENEGKKITNFEQAVNFMEIKYVKVRVKNPGACPAWHLGAGNPSWLFLDEIIIE